MGSFFGRPQWLNTIKIGLDFWKQPCFLETVGVIPQKNSLPEKKNRIGLKTYSRSYLRFDRKKLRPIKRVM